MHREYSRGNDLFFILYFYIFFIFHFYIFFIFHFIKNFKKRIK